MNPEWNQDFTFTLDLPADNAFELKEWLEAHVVAIELFDQVIVGNFSYVEVLARSSVSMKQLVYTLDNPYYMSLKMSSVEGFYAAVEQNVTLNLSIFDPNGQNYKIISWIDANTERHDEDFVNNFGDKLEKDFKDDSIWGISQANVSVGFEKENFNI